jgi:tellurite resistance protein
MTPSEKNIVKSLVAVAWADGKVEQVETAVINGLLCGFDATEAEEQELLEYAKEKRSFDADIPLGELTVEDREILLANAALLTNADGEQTPDEKAVLDRLVGVLNIPAHDVEHILESVRDGALSLGSNVLEPVD